MQEDNPKNNVDDKIEDIPEEQEEKEAKGIKPNQAVELFAGITSNLVPDLDIQTRQGQVVNMQDQYKKEYKKNKATYLEMIDFEELTEGGDLSEWPEWVRWTIAGAILIVPAGVNVMQYRKQAKQLMQREQSKNKNKNKGGNNN